MRCTFSRIQNASTSVWLVFVLSSVLMAESLPGWFLNPSESKTHIYSTGAGNSTRKDIALQKASISARAELSLTQELRIETLTKLFQEEILGGNNSTNLLEHFISATVTVSSAILKESKLENKYFEQDGETFYAYVLYSIPRGSLEKKLIEDMNDRISDDVELNARFRSSHAFKELDNEVKKFEVSKKENEE